MYLVVELPAKVLPNLWTFFELLRFLKAYSELIVSFKHPIFNLIFTTTACNNYSTQVRMQ